MISCAYCDCEETKDLILDDELEVWLCKDHVDSPGYCSRDCQLGYGCDETC